MKITDERPNDRMYFGNLEQGDVFTYNGHILLKIHSVDYVNCIYLKDGKGASLLTTDLCKPLDAELIIRG